MYIRHSEQRGRARFGWLDSRHSFSFGHYYDPAHMGFGPLRVINQDVVSPGAGFDTHGHRDMEIISYVLRGGLEHRDSLGNGSVIVPGELQRMSAGTGIRHSEYNHSRDSEVEFLQIWIEPAELGLQPGYEQKAFPQEESRNQFRLIGSQDGRQGSVTIAQDVNLYVAHPEAGTALSLDTRESRQVWVQVVRGGLEVNGVALVAGDGLGLKEVTSIGIQATEASEFLLFDMGAK